MQGSHILSVLASHVPQITTTALARKDLPQSAKGVEAALHIESDSSKWPGYVQSLSPAPSAFFSALGTSKAKAGSLEAQRKIDLDLNLDLARAAKQAGTQVYVLISSAGTGLPVPYSKMKLDLENAVTALGFQHTIILKPGLLVGKREESRPAEAMLRFVASSMGNVSNKLVDFWAQEVDVIAKSAVAAAQRCTMGEREQGVWKLEQHDIVRLGRTEWKG